MWEYPFKMLNKLYLEPIHNSYNSRIDWYENNNVSGIDIWMLRQCFRSVLWNWKNVIFILKIIYSFECNGSKSQFGIKKNERKNKNDWRKIKTWNKVCHEVKELKSTTKSLLKIWIYCSLAHFSSFSSQNSYHLPL